MIASDERNVRKLRAKSIESATTCKVARGNLTAAIHMSLILILITSRIVTAAPPPPPESMPLWYSASTLASLGMSITPPPESSIALHHFDLPCQTCHIPGNTNGNRKMPQESIWRMSVDINRACLSSGCHDYDPVLNHPVGVNVPGSLPESMPLNGFSQITCLTCHTDSESSYTADIDEDPQELMLTVPQGEDLCGSCHMQMSGTLKQQSHWRFSNKAHLGSINPRSALPSQVELSFDDIDLESQTCLGCHEEVTVTIPGYNETYTEKAARWSRMKDHPIGMDYRRVAMNQSSEYYYPLFNAERIRFFDGKVGCGSCHSMYSKQAKNVSVDKQNGNLCRQCHNR